MYERMHASCHFFMNEVSYMKYLKMLINFHVWSFIYEIASVTHPVEQIQFMSVNRKVLFYYKIKNTRPYICVILYATTVLEIPPGYIKYMYVQALCDVSFGHYVLYSSLWFQYLLTLRLTYLNTMKRISHIKISSGKGYLPINLFKICRNNFKLWHHLIVCYIYLWKKNKLVSLVYEGDLSCDYHER